MNKKNDSQFHFVLKCHLLFLFLVEANTALAWCSYMTAAQLSVLLHVYLNIDHPMLICLYIFLDHHWSRKGQKCLAGYGRRLLVRFSHSVLLCSHLVRWWPNSFPFLSDLYKPGDLLSPPNLYKN